MTDNSNGALLASLGEGQNREPSAVTEGPRGDAASTTSSVPSGTDARQMTLPIALADEPLSCGTFAGADLALERDDWEAWTFGEAIRHLAASGTTFTSDTARGLVGDPQSPALLGAAFAAASRRGEIVAVSVQPSNRRERRGGLRRLWRGSDEFVGSFRTADREAVG